MKNHHFLLPILFLALLAGPVLFALVPVAPEITKENAATFYKAPSFTRLTPQPRHVAPLTALLCGRPSPELIVEEMAKTGPHYQARIHIYANEPVVTALKNKVEVFPEGSVIIKEKLDDKDGVSAVGGMIKRKKGYDQENGDWEYFYFSPGGELTSGRMQNCIDCHRAPDTTDHVYSLWKIGQYPLLPYGRGAAD